MAQSLKIMHIIDSLAIGGKERMAVDLANLTARKGYHVSICVTRQKTTLAGELDREVPLYVLNRRWRFDAGGMFRFWKILRKEKPELLHVHGRACFSFVAFLKTIGVVRQPVIFHDHYGLIERDSAVPVWLGIWGRRFARVYVGVYQRLGQWAEKAGFHKQDIRVIGNSINLERLEQSPAADLRQEIGADEGENIVVSVCDLRPEKGVDVLIEAIVRTGISKESVFVIIGGESDPVYAARCRSAVKAGRLEKQVLFLGQRANTPALLKAANFAVIPSLSESGPLVLIEYLAAGLPFVATRAGDIAAKTEAVFPGAFVVPGDADMLGKKISELVKQAPEKLEKIKAQGRDLACRSFDLRERIQEWLELYEEIAGRVSE